jgi:hypothetical protein
MPPVCCNSLWAWQLQYRPELHSRPSIRFHTSTSDCFNFPPKDAPRIASMAQPVSYTPLEGDTTIRLLGVRGSPDRDGDVHCEMLVTDLHGPVPYEAISYTWQDQAPDEEIFIDGKSLAVGHNCRAALRRFRPNEQGQARRLWIDAVCIDQSKRNSPEKSQQVGLMSRIYASADLVLVWLEPYPLAPEIRAKHLRAASWMSEIATASTSPDVNGQVIEIERVLHDANLDGK